MRSRFPVYAAFAAGLTIPALVGSAVAGATTPGTAAAGTATSGTATSGTGVSDSTDHPVITLAAGPLTGELGTQLSQYLGIDQADLATPLAAAGAPAFVPVVQDGILASIDTIGSAYQHGAELVWGLAPSDSKATYDEVVAALQIPADYESQTGNQTDDGRVSYYGEFDNPADSAEPTTIDRYKVQVVADDKATFVLIGTWSKAEDESAPPAIPQAVTDAAKGALDAANANSALTLDTWTYSLGNSMFMVFGSEQTPRWEVNYMASDGTQRDALATELCGSDATDKDDTFVSCESAEDGGRKVRISETDANSGIARRVSIGSN